jgi:alcohol dehydrogenase class IV
VRYAEIAQILTREKDVKAPDGAAWASELVEELKIPRLSAYGMKPEDFPEAVRKTQKANSFKGNPIALDEKELTAILEKAL